MKKRIYRVLIINSFLILILLSYYLLSTNTGFYIPCLFRMVTGLKCPGCGITHYFMDIIKLDFNSAFFENPFVFICLPILLIYYVIVNYNYVKYNDRKKVMIPNYVTYGLIIIAILFGIFRNIWNF